MMWEHIAVMMVTNYLSKIINTVIGMSMNGLATKIQQSGGDWSWREALGQFMCDGGKFFCDSEFVGVQIYVQTPVFISL